MNWKWDTRYYTRGQKHRLPTCVPWTKVSGTTAFQGNQWQKGTFEISWNFSMKKCTKKSLNYNFSIKITEKANRLYLNPIKGHPFGDIWWPIISTYLDKSLSVTFFDKFWSVTFFGVPWNNASDKVCQRFEKVGDLWHKNLHTLYSKVLQWLALWIEFWAEHW